MSSGAVNLQAQVESVLGALVKAASLELVKLFESRYRASAEDAGRAGAPESLVCVSSGDNKRSVGVQVEEDVCLPLELADSTFLQDVGCLSHSSEVMMEGCLITVQETLLAEDPFHADPEWAPQTVADAVDTEESRVLELESSAAQTEMLNETTPEAPRCPLTQSPPAELKLLVIKPEPSDAASEEKVEFVCPLILKPDSLVPKVELSEKPVQAEPQQACVSTAKGTAYSPSLSDGAATPSQVGVWERINPPKETKNDLQMKLKLTSKDQKLLLPCAVQLVDVLTVPESELKTDGKPEKAQKANHSSSQPLPKDLRRHQGPHTGHRLCCFTQCGNGVWRLQKIVTHSREGYVCNICEKAFKRRKFLRRHERFHTGERPYPCPTCSKTFALRKSLRRHLRFHTGERPHECSQCGKSFRLRDNLKAHLRFHSGEKPFSCSKCGKMFRIMRNLEKHQLSQCEYFVPSFRAIAGLQL
ncbi:zinc finger protein 17 [Kryptolebias marmoratus]|uniref:zinc finger protein 17 n=1 Tax=Kryptolebias marmoratus TaxID=37003 RepID=UPI0018AC9C0B|nr:zinc finger protein 17 [Kryptolebias marmoratus]